MKQKSAKQKSQLKNNYVDVDLMNGVLTMDVQHALNATGSFGNTYSIKIIIITNTNQSGVLPLVSKPKQ
jgi:hypothetical protein